MSQSTRLTVQEYAESIGKSKQSVYNRIKRGTLQSTTVDKQVYVLVDENVDNIDNQINEVNQPLNNPIENSEKSIEQPIEISLEKREVKSLKKENKKLRKIIDSKDLEIRDLLERIISIENNQKNEIIKQQEQKHQELKMYMEFIQKQSENVLPPMATTQAPLKEYKHTNKYDDVIDADIEKDKKKKKKNKKDKKK